MIELSEEQRALQELAHAFAERELRPVAREVDEADVEMRWDVWRKAAEVGLTSFMLPEEYGGGGVHDAFTECLIQEELYWGDAGFGGLITSGGFFAAPVLVLGSDEQKRRWLEPIAGDDPPLTALATTEPGHGSDAAGIETHARRVDGGYRLRGQKTWVSNGGVAELYVVFAQVDPGARSRGVTAFVLEKGDEGLSFGEPMRKM